MCFLNQKKGLETYIIVVLIFSLFISSFLIFISVAIYGEEHENCKYIDFEITDSCINEKSVAITIQNLGQNSLNLEIDGERNTNYIIFPETKTKQISVLVSEEQTSIVLLPYLEYTTKSYVCSAKTQKINTQVLRIC